MKVSHIIIFPIKSLDPIKVKEAKINKEGGLEYDRLIAFFDPEGKILTKKREKKLYKIRSNYDLDKFEVRLKVENLENTFSLEDINGLSQFMSDFLGYKVTARKGYFPDSKDTPGPTIVSTETLKEVASWYGFSLEETRLRFRTNIEISAEYPFWEDRLCGSSFRIGSVEMKGVNISRRCNIPPADPFTGERKENFENIFIEKRKRALPSWVREECMKGFYRLAINTTVPPSEKGKLIKEGDEIKVIS